MSHYEISSEQVEAKPFYRNREAAESVVPEIKTHIKETGEPHTWRHHTHSKPVTGSRIVYIGQFDLPKSHQAPDRHAPCPCCSPRSPKYSRNGKIAWFPDEHVIRMLGPDCFKTLNPEGHWEAMAQFDREEAERRTIDYLLNNLHLVRGALDVGKTAVPTLDIIDQVHAKLSQRLQEVVRIDLWRHVMRGELNVSVRARRMRRHANGSETVEDFTDIQRLSQFPGFRMFSPKTSRLAGRMGGCLKRLGFVDFGDEAESRLREMTQPDRAKAAKLLSDGLSTMRNILDDAEKIRSGFDRVSVATLRGWTRHHGCPVSIFIDGDESSFYIGTDENQKVRIELPATFWVRFGQVPEVVTVKNWGRG